MEPISIFIAYSDKDTPLKDDLRTFLSPILDKGHIGIWDKSDVKPGQEQEKVIKAHLENANIVLAMVSADFLNSREDFDTTLESHNNGRSIVVPIILDGSLWKATELASLGSLPTQGRTVDKMSSPKEAWNEVAVAVSKWAQYLVQVSSQYQTAFEDAKEHFDASHWSKAKKGLNIALSLPQPGFRPDISHLLEMRETCESGELKEKEENTLSLRQEAYQNAVGQAERLFGIKKWNEAKDAYNKAKQIFETGFTPHMSYLESRSAECEAAIVQQPKEENNTEKLWDRTKWVLSLANKPIIYKRVAVVVVVLLFAIALNALIRGGFVTAKQPEIKKVILPDSCQIKPALDMRALLYYTKRFKDCEYAKIAQRQYDSLNLIYIGLLSESEVFESNIKRLKAYKQIPERKPIDPCVPIMEALIINPDGEIAKDRAQKLGCILKNTK